MQKLNSAFSRHHNINNQQIKHIKEKYEFPNEPALFETIENYPLQDLKSFPVEIVTSDSPRVGKTHYIITQIKEKFGELRWYDAGFPADSNIDDLVEIYSYLSGNICIECGKPDVPIVQDWWISPYCENCWIDISLKKHDLNNSISAAVLVKDAKESYNELASANYKLPTEYKYTRFSKEDKKEVCIDISDKVNAIRDNWNKYLKHKEK